MRLLLPLTLVLLACGGGKPADEPRTWPEQLTTPSLDGGATDGGTPDGGTTLPSEPVPTYDCPAPPKDAWIFHAGTLVSDQVYYRTEENGDGWQVIVTGISYVHEQACRDLVEYNKFERPVKEGDRPGDFLFELAMSVPGAGPTDWLGEHDSGNGYMLNPSFPAHHLKIGWRDAPDQDYHFVQALPFGWTESTICVGYLSPDRLYLTVLWDPVEGPYRTNLHTSIDHPIWFDMEIWPTSDGWGDYDPVYGAHRSCALTAWVGDVSEEELFAGYDWEGRYPTWYAPEASRPGESRSE